MDVMDVPTGNKYYWIYAVSSELYEDADGTGSYKLGFTSTPYDDVYEAEKRLMNRYCTSLIGMRVVSVLPVSHGPKAEKSLFRQLTPYRLDSKHEFFKGDFESVIFPAMIGTAIGYSRKKPVPIQAFEEEPPAGEEEHESIASDPPSRILETQREAKNNRNQLMIEFIRQNARYSAGNVVTMERVRTMFSSWLGTEVTSLDNGTFGQVHGAYVVDTVNACKYCMNEHKKGCCDAYSRTGRTTKKIVRNLELVSP